MSYYANTAACVVLLLWALWKAAAPSHVGDTPVAKILYSLIGLASAGIILGPVYGYRQPPMPEIVLNCALAATAIRHYWIVRIKPNVRRWIRCRDCPFPPEE